MWNWLVDCYEEGSLTREELERVMKDEKAARQLWEEWSYFTDVVGCVRDEVWPFLEYLKKKEIDA